MPSQPFRIAYVLVDDAVTNPVVHSVAEQYLGLVADRIGPVDFLGFESGRTWLHGAEAVHRAENTIRSRLQGGRARILLRVPTTPLMPLNARRALPFLREAMRMGGGRLVIHGRGMKGSWIGAWCKRRLPGARLIFDTRGVDAFQKFHPDASAQAFELAAHDPRMRRLARMEAGALAAADAVVAMSSPLREYLRRAHKNATFPEPQLVPTCADTNLFRLDEEMRQARRRDLGAQGRVVWVYTGTLDSYARPELCARWFALFHRLAPQHAFILALSPQWRRLAGMLQAEGIPASAFRAFEASFDEMPGWLNAGDVGIVLRDTTLVGRVSLPIKVGEFLACGMSVLSGGSPGGLPDILSQTPAGIDFPTPEPTPERAAQAWERLRVHLDDSAERRAANREVALRLLSWETHLPRMLEIYRRLGGESL